MAVRTGTLLKSDLAAIETALATAATTPSAVNLAAVVTACQTVEQNGRDSRAVASSQTGHAGPLGSDYGALARTIRRDVQSLQATGHGDASLVSANDTRRQVNRIRKSVTKVDAPFQAAKSQPTTT